MKWQVSFVIVLRILFLAVLPINSLASDTGRVTTDAILQLAKLTASDGMPGDGFGISVAISGNTLVVGAADADGIVGAAYVFVKPAGGWQNMTQTAKLTPSNPQANLYFGYSVAISGDTIVVGQFSTVDNPHNRAAYVFVKPPGGWHDMTETAQLQDPQAAHVSDTFGASLAISGETVVVCAPYSGTFLGPGHAYVFLQPTGGWKTTSYPNAVLTPSDSFIGDDFGVQVAIDRGTIAIGDSFASVRGNPEGAGYVFVKPASGWVNMTQTAKLTGTDEFPGMDFGAGISISGDTVAVVSVYGYCAYVFVKPAAGWADMTQTAELYPLVSFLDQFLLPSSVAVSGNVVYVGEWAYASYQGALFPFVKPGEGWQNMTANTILSASDGEVDDLLGNATAANDGVTIAGAYRSHVTNGQSGPGAAYIFGK
jgi:hypothetical protein